MKNFLCIALLLVGLTAFGQGKLMNFVRTNGTSIVLNTDDIAFAYPSSNTTTTLVIGPSIRTEEINEKVDSICLRSYGTIVPVTEIQVGRAGEPTRTVGVSRSHIGTVITGSPSTRTEIRMKNPIMTVVASGTYANVIPTLVGNYNAVVTDTAKYTLKYGLNVIKHAATVATDSLFLPKTPRNGDWVKVVYGSTATSLKVLGNGKTILGTAVSTASAGVDLLYEFFGGAIDAWIRTE